MKISDLNFKIILAGGSSAHANLFEYLLRTTFRSSSNIKDYRIGHSLISIFPPQYHAWLALIFWQAELEQKELYNDDTITGIYNPWRVLKLHHPINKLPYGEFLIPYLTLGRPKSTLNLQRLMNLNYEGDVANGEDYQTKLDRLLGETTNSTLLRELLAENNRPKAAYVLGKWLGYADSNIQNITRFFEQWSFNL